MQSCPSVHHVHHNHNVPSIMSKKNLSAGGSLPWGWGRQLLLPVHHHTELFVAELVVLQMYFLLVFFLLHVDVNLVFYSIKIPFTPDDNQFISIQSCAPPTNHLVVVVFSESRVNLRFAQTPTSSLRKANWLKLTLLPRWNAIMKRCFDILQGAKRILMSTIKVFCRLKVLW